MHYVAKVELFEKRWQGWILSRLGAFPVRRGQSDEEAIETARVILERGGAVCIFPEGTRIRTRLARRARSAASAGSRCETGAAVLPVAVHGTEHVRRGWRIRPRKVRLRAGKALTFPRTENPRRRWPRPSPTRIWPNIELQWEWLGGLPPLRKAAVIGAGSWGTAVAVLLARGGVEVQLGTPHRRAGARRSPPSARTPLPAGGQPPRLDHGQARRRHRGRRPRPGLPRRPVGVAAARGRRARRPDRLAHRGAAAQQGPGAAAGHAARRVRRRADPLPRDRLPRRPGARQRGGLRHRRARARLAPTPTCAPSSATSSTAPAWSASAPTTSSASRWPAPPRTPPRSPPPPPSRTASTRPGSPPPRSGASASTTRSARGAELETFSGLAGVGDLTAT